MDDDHVPEYVLNTTFTNVSLENQPEEEIEFQVLLKILRQLYIKDMYGENYYANFIVTFIVCLVGYVTNGLNLAVFSRTQLSNPMNRLLLTLTIADILQITTQISHIIHFFDGFPMYPYYEWYIYTLFNTFFETATSFVSNWLIVIIGIWITSFVKWQLGLSRWFTSKSITICTIILVSFGIALALPIFMQITYHTISFREHVLYEITFSALTKTHNGLFLKLYWSALLLRSFVPVLIGVVIVAVLGWNLCKMCIKRKTVTNKSSSSILNFKTTIMLSILLVLFLVSNLPDAFLMLVALVSDGDYNVGKKYSSATEIIRLFMLANNALTFFVYFGLGVEFRRIFKRMFCCSKEESDSNSEGNENEKVEEATI